MSERWKLGDVIIWFQTGTDQDAKTDSDVLLKFYDDEEQLIGWVQAFERHDLAAFEEGDANCGYLGNINKNAWLKSLLQQATKVGVAIEKVSPDRPKWYLERVTLDFRIGPKPETVTARSFRVAEWITPGAGEVVFECENLVDENATNFPDVGFDKELEIDAGGPQNVPSRAG